MLLGSASVDLTRALLHVPLPALPGGAGAGAGAGAGGQGGHVGEVSAVEEETLAALAPRRVAVEGGSQGSARRGTLELRVFVEDRDGV